MVEAKVLDGTVVEEIEILVADNGTLFALVGAIIDCGADDNDNLLDLNND